MQMICALLIFQTPDLPAPLAKLSPWLDWLITPRDRVLARLGAQTHRRFIKTHTPLDGIPLDPLATYIVVGRHPLDMAVSLYYQGANIDRDRVRELTAASVPPPATPPATPPPAPAPAGPPQVPPPASPQPTPRPALHDWMVSWIDSQDRPEDQLDSLPGIFWHLSDAWSRRDRPGPAVILVHYDDLLANLEGEMRRLAGLLGIDVPEATWPALVRAATFEEMRAKAVAQAPDPAGVLKDPAAFFRRGYSGAGHEVLTAEELGRYYARTARLAQPDLLAWLHRQSLLGLGRVEPGVAG
jgi:hypothetical protein